MPVYGPTPLTIALGGTGQITKAAAEDALSPMTTQGDIEQYDGSHVARLGPGTAGQALLSGGAGANNLWGPTGYNLVAGHGAWSPADATTYFWGLFQTLAAGAVAGLTPIYIPKAGRITSVSLWATVAGTLATSETASVILRVNDTTDNALGTATYTALKSGPFLFTGLSIAVNAGDFFEIKQLTPTWVTNPTSVLQGAQVYVSVP